MRIVFILIVAIHGIIHLLGFLKAFELLEVKELSEPISRLEGMGWLVSCLLFLWAGTFFFMENQYWWLVGIVAILISQGVIFYNWDDAKYGSIPNVIILLVVILYYANFNFNNSVEREINEILTFTEEPAPYIITEESLMVLPDPVSKWLRNCGLIGKEEIRTVYMEQSAKLKMNPDQEDWTSASAIQYINAMQPSFVWKVAMKLNKIIDITGRDKYAAGKGEMVIKAFSLIPIVNAKENKNLDAATLQRFLGEIVLYPSAALSPYVSWEEVDPNTAKAKMTYMGTKGEGTFHFDDNGIFVKYTAMRFKDPADENPTEWIIDVEESTEMNGILIPTHMKVTWRLEDGDWTWLDLEISEIDYNIR